MEEQKEKSNIGGVWEGKTKAGAEKLSIKCDEDLKAGLYYTVLLNQYKTEEKHPKWRILPQNDDFPPNPV